MSLCGHTFVEPATVNKIEINFREAECGAGNWLETRGSGHYLEPFCTIRIKITASRRQVVFYNLSVQCEQKLRPSPLPLHIIFV